MERARYIGLATAELESQTRLRRQAIRLKPPGWWKEVVSDPAAESSAPALDDADADDDGAEPD